MKNSVYELPRFLKILSWNYDYQFEKAYSDYSDKQNLEDNQSSLNVISKHKAGDAIQNAFGIYKLNGTAGVLHNRDFHRHKFFVNLKSKFDQLLIENVVENYALAMESSVLISPLSFAFEDWEDNDQNIINKAILATSSTNILIVIGYSFPFFNREVDRKIIGSMKSLEKVYFQAPDANDLKERFLSIIEGIPDNMLIPRFDLNQFLLPNEL